MAIAEASGAASGSPDSDQRQGSAGRLQPGSLILLPLISVIPIVAFAAAVVIYVSQQQQRALETEIVQIARHASQAADLVLNEELGTLRALGAVASEHGLDEFARHADLHLSSMPRWRSIAVHDEAGSLLAYRGRADLPGAERGRHAAVDQADLPIARVGHDQGREPFLVLADRIAGTDGEDLVVSATGELDHFSQVLSGLADPHWTVAILDSEAVIAGRSRDPWRFVGREATPSLRSELESARERFFYALNQEGERVYTAFSTSPQSGWSAAVGAPASLVEGPLDRARWAWIGAGLIAVGLAGLLAWVLISAQHRRHVAERFAWQLKSEREAEARLSEIARHFPGVMYRRVLHPDGQVSHPYISQGVTQLLGHDAGVEFATPKPLDQLLRAHVLPEDRPAVVQALRRSAETLEPFSVQARIMRSDGGIAWIRSAATANAAPDGSIVWDGVLVDVTELKESEAALQARTETLRTVTRVNLKLASELDRESLVQAVLDAGRTLIGAAFGAFFYTLRGNDGESFTLYKLSGARPEEFSKFPMPRNTAIFGPTFRGEAIIRLDDVTRDPRYGRNKPYRGMPEGHLPVRAYLAAPVTSRSGEVLGGLFFGHPEPGMFDETAEEVVAGIAAQAAVALENARLFQAAEDELAQRREAEAQQSMLLAELNHRVKNSLAVVLAIAQQTARSSDTIEQFNQVFRGRIMALANAHTLLTAGEWRATTLHALVSTALEPYAAKGDERISVTGPEVVVPPKQALALGLVFHELATNASKYGALSPAGGHLSIGWEGEDPGTLVLHWRERTSAQVGSPERDGFGSRLITTNISRELGGTIERDFRPDGFSAEMRLPWNPDGGMLVSSDNGFARDGETAGNR